MQYHDWQGRSGNWYRHIVCGAVPRDVKAANYILGRRNADASLSPLYVGETDDLQRRLAEHSRSGLIAEALRLGLNELHLHFGQPGHLRERVETDLRHAHPAPLNRQAVPARAARTPAPAVNHLAVAHPRLSSPNIYGLAALNALLSAPRQPETTPNLFNALRGNQSLLGKLSRDY